MAQYDPNALRDFAARYTAAWCSRDPAGVAGFFSPGGSLTINEGVPSAGRAAITAVAKSFMDAFPDMVVSMNRVRESAGRVIFEWTLTGTNTGPGGTGRRVRISGSESWLLAGDGLITESLGSFDAKEYQRQLEHGFA